MPSSPRWQLQGLGGAPPSLRPSTSLRTTNARPGKPRTRKKSSICSRWLLRVTTYMARHQGWLTRAARSSRPSAAPGQAAAASRRAEVRSSRRRGSVRLHLFGPQLLRACGHLTPRHPVLDSTRRMGRSRHRTRHTWTGEGRRSHRRDQTRGHHWRLRAVGSADATAACRLSSHVEWTVSSERTRSSHYQHASVDTASRSIGSTRRSAGHRPQSPSRGAPTAAAASLTAILPLQLIE